VNLNSSSGILLHTSVEEVRLCEVKSNAISAKSVTFKLGDADLQPHFTTWCIQILHRSSTFASTKVGTRNITYHASIAAHLICKSHPYLAFRSSSTFVIRYWKQFTASSTNHRFCHYS